MKKVLFIFMAVMLVGSMILVACKPTPTEAPATEEPAPVEEQPAEEAPAEEQPTEAPPEPTAVPPTEVPPPAEPTRLVLVEGGGYTSLDPFTNAWHANPTYAVFAILWDYSRDLKQFGGILAESWSFAEDNLSATIKLKQNLTFTDGTPVNAEAIKWNFDKYLDPELSSPTGGTMRQMVKDVEIIDDLTFKVNMLDPWAFFMDEMAGKEIASPTAYETLGPDEYSNQLISAGPYIVQEIVPDVSILYVKNPDYTYGNPFASQQGPEQFDELLIKYISDEAVVYASLETGEIDMAPIPAQYLQQAKDNPNIEVVESKTTTTYYMGFNNEFYPFTEEGVRQAIAYAIDREEINLIALEGAGYILYQPLPPANVGYNEALQDYGMATSNDVEKAKAMLDELGFTDINGDGFREDPNGKKMQYELMFPKDVAERQRIAETLQAQLLNIGINTYLVVVDGTLMRQRTAEGSHQMFTWMYGMLTPDIMTYIFHSSRIGASNRNHVNDPVLDGLLEAQDQQLDPVKRQAATDAIQTYLIDHRFHVPLVSPMAFTGYRSDKIGCVEWTILGGCFWEDMYPVK